MSDCIPLRKRRKQKAKRKRRKMADVFASGKMASSEAGGRERKDGREGKAKRQEKLHLPNPLAIECVFLSRTESLLPSERSERRRAKLTVHSAVHSRNRHIESKWGGHSDNLDGEVAKQAD